MAYPTPIKLKMYRKSEILENASEIIKDRLYFATLGFYPESTPGIHYFNIDRELVYVSFYDDFGPLNISNLYNYCMKINEKLSTMKNKRIVHFTTMDDEKRVNAACLVGGYAVIYLRYQPIQALHLLSRSNKTKFISFRDASGGKPYTITLLDCLNGIYRAHNLGFFDFTRFNDDEYKYYEKVENGDLNWIVPGKFLAFCGPQNISGHGTHTPDRYFCYFRRNNVTCIVRLNKKEYDSNRFVNAGFIHSDLYFVDGSTPPEKILHEFLEICEEVEGAIAIHCKAGLGRTGTLIGCYLMKHYQFTAHEAIAWIRMCRPGSVIGHQQEWLEEMQGQMWKDGDAYRKKNGIAAPIKHKFGIYSDNLPEPFEPNLEERSVKINEGVTRILKKVDTMRLHDRDENIGKAETSMTQGDKLNAIKARRQSRLSKMDSPNAAENTQTTLITSRRSSLRKTTVIKSTTVSIVKGKQKALQKKTENGWTVETNIVKTIDLCKGEAKDIALVKRGKRSLVLEKDKTCQRSVKVLRRSHVQEVGNETDVKSRQIKRKCN